MLTSALVCLAANVYFEARAENIAGQYAVALVTMNRANHNKRQVCGVVLKPSQFSWTAERVTGKSLTPASIPSGPAWDTAKIIAKTVLAGKMRDFTWGATHFHNKTVRPQWKYRMRLTKVIGGHYFYRVV